MWVFDRGHLLCRFSRELWDIHGTESCTRSHGSLTVEGTRPVAVKVVANTLDRNDEVF